MANLTQEQRDKIPAHHFALPDKRELPIHDETHTRLAWTQVNHTHGLSDAERAEARRNIMHRAHELGMDTSDWTSHSVSAHSFDAMGVSLPEWSGHPNRIPFSGVMTKLDEPSDNPVGGAKGKRVLITTAVAERALPSLIGMAVDFKPDFDGHDNRNKIGLITEAEIRGRDLWIAGFLYGADFPAEVADIKRLKDQLGFSYEARCAVESWKTDPVEVTDCVFTGAAILFKDLAAYTSTSLEASASAKDIFSMTPEELRALMAEAMKPLNDEIAALKASNEKLTAEVAAAGVVGGKVKEHSDAIRACAASMEAAGIGLHAERGHVAVLHKIANSMDAEAAVGKVPHIYNDHSWLSAADEAQAAELKTAQDALSAANDENANLKQEVAELKAQGFNKSEQPQRQIQAGKGGKDQGETLEEKARALTVKLKAEGKTSSQIALAITEMRFEAAAAESAAA